MAVRGRRKSRQRIFIFTLAIFFAAYILLAERAGPGSTSSTAPNARQARSSESRPESVVCIVGNAETKRDALRTHRMWDNAFPSLWYVWGEGSHRDIDDGQPFPETFEVVFGTSGSSLTWARGIEMLVERLRKTRKCEYVFTHDDDLVFYPGNNSSSVPISQILSRVLQQYRPAVAAFPWKHGDLKIPAMKEVEWAFRDDEVAPLTGFDSGMVLYHHSIVELFIPFAPRGEGGFYGDWSLPAHVLNLLGPLTFREYAIRINALQYDNLINLDTVPDNVKMKSLRQAKQVQGSKLVMRPESRHPYEYKMNTPFKKFLSEGLKPRSRNWGRTLRLSDLTWRPTPGNPPWSRWWILKRIHEFYDVQHPLLRANRYIQSQYSMDELEGFLQGTVMPPDHSETQVIRQDQCTLVLTVYDRLTTFLDRLAHYHTFSGISSIVVIWNNPSADPPPIQQNQYRVPFVILRQKRNSLSNRFLPHPEITTDCIVNMDDDWDMPHEHMSYAIYLWRNAFRDALVGFRHQSRTHISVDGTWRYNRENKHGASIVLPSGLVYHRKFQTVYSRAPRAALKMVDDYTNCDDILLNFVVANETGLCPVIIDVGKPGASAGKPIAGLGEKGLWKKRNGDHVSERHHCMQQFAELFGRMPLRYSVSFFSVESIQKMQRHERTHNIRNEQQCTDVVQNLSYTYT